MKYNRNTTQIRGVYHEISDFILDMRFTEDREFTFIERCVLKEALTELNALIVDIEKGKNI